MKKFDILDMKQVFGDDRLKFFDIYGTRCSPTDYAILTGGYVFQFCYTKEGRELKDRTCCWWLKTLYLGDVFYIDGYGYRGVRDVYTNNYVLRPIVDFSKISKEMKNIKKDSMGIETGQYGTYPNSLVNEKYAYKLEKLFKSGGLNKTGKQYKTDTKVFDEYKHHGKNFIRIQLDNDMYIKQLNDGTQIKKGNIYWLNVEPIEWLIDRENDKAIAKKGIVSDIKFDTNLHYYGEFSETNIKKFLDNEFEHELVPSKCEGKNIETSKTITVNDIINYKYKNASNMSKQDKQKMLVELLEVDENDLESARVFVKQMGEEYLKIFDALWVNNTNKLSNCNTKIYNKIIKG